MGGASTRAGGSQGRGHDRGAVSKTLRGDGARSGPLEEYVGDGNEASVGPGHQARARGCGQGSEDRLQQDPGGRSFRSQGSRFGADSGLPEWSYGELTMGIA